MSIILSSCISDELLSGYQGNQIHLTRRNCIFLLLHTWAARATLANGSPEKSTCSLKGIQFFTAVRCLPAESGISPTAPACREGYAVLDRPNSFGNHYISLTVWEEVERKQIVIGRAESSLHVHSRRESLYCSLYFISDTIPVRSRSWFILVDKLCSLSAQVHTLLTTHQE